MVNKDLHKCRYQLQQVWNAVPPTRDSFMFVPPPGFISDAVWTL